MTIENDLATLPRRIRASIDANAPERLRRGLVWCRHCGRGPVSVIPGEALAHGWPKCCGYTMTIDAPEERTP